MTLPDLYGEFVPRRPRFSFIERGGRTLIVLEQILVYIDPDGERDVIEPGLWSDGQSVPWILEPLAGDRYDEPFLLPAIFHDRDSREARKVGGREGYRIRKRGDEKFKIRIRAAGGTALQANRQYAGVCLGRFAEWARGWLR